MPSPSGFEPSASTQGGEARVFRGPPRSRGPEGGIAYSRRRSSRRGPPPRPRTLIHLFHVRLAQGDTSETRVFSRALVRFGRLADNDLVLPDPDVPDRVGTLELLPRPLLPPPRRAAPKTHPSPAFRITSPSGAVQELLDGETIQMRSYRLTLVRGAPPGPREAEFLRGLEETPSDDALRLVYADWLEEGRRAIPAKFVRDEVKLSALAPGTEEHLRAKDALHAAADGFPAHWRRTISCAPIENCRAETACPGRWSELMPTTDPNQRHCPRCQTNVYYAITLHGASRLVGAGRLVVLDVSLPREPGDLEPRPPLDGHRRPGPGS